MERTGINSVSVGKIFADNIPDLHFGEGKVWKRMEATVKEQIPKDRKRGMKL
jgi:hypothetical protein